MSRDVATAPKTKSVTPRYGAIEFDVWGSRGSRNLTPPDSRIANYTSCYSLRAGEELFVLDGVRGLGVLSHAVARIRRFRDVRRVHLFLSHSHMDHWEGLKDANWFWQMDNRLELNVLGTEEAVETVRAGYAHPAYVPLEILAERTLKRLRFETLDVGARFERAGWQFETFALNHYSGAGKAKNPLATLGYRARSPEGFTLSYLCDHEPNESTEEVESRMLEGAHVAIIDAHFTDRALQAFGHGSQEHAALLARRYPDTLVVAAHYGPTYSDRQIQQAFRRHGKGLPNFALAVEGMTYRWSIRSKRFLTPVRL